MADRERLSEDRVGALIESSLRVAIPIRNKLADLMLVHLWHVCPNCESPLHSNARFCNTCGSGIGVFGVTSQPRQVIPSQPSTPPIQLRYQCENCEKLFRAEEALQEHYANNPQHAWFKD